MQIGLNGQQLLIDKLAGPEIYTLNTFRSFAKVDKKNDYIVYFSKTPPKDFWQELIQGNDNFSYKVVGSLLSWTHVGLARQLFKDKVDVFFGATHTIPFFRPVNTIFISMIHGLEYKVNMQLKKLSFKFVIRPLILWWVIRHSRLTIVPSKAVKDAVLSLRWPFIKADKIRIIHEGVSEDYYKRPDKEVQKVREKYQLGNMDYLYFVSTIQPRKNIPNMVHGFSMALEENPRLKNTKLLISGKLGWMYQDSLDAPKRYSVEENVSFLGRTPDDELPVLYSGAHHFINLSFEEGFGIPLLESMACETPAVVSDIPAFRELGRVHPIYVDPHSVDSIKKGITRALTEKKDFDNIKKARELSQKYTWDSTAFQLVSIFESFFKHL